MKEKILELLIGAGDFISGEEISKVLGVSRTAIWKNIKKLKNEGYEIESITNKGYHIVGYPSHFVKHEVKHLIKDVKIINEVKVLKKVDSTNKEARRMAIDGINNALIIAEEQIGGKGRRGRGWISPPNVGIFMSLLLKPDILPQNASMLTIVAGVAVRRAIYNVTGQKCLIKWPNDLVINAKKVCGILTEMSSEIDTINYVVVGIGINVNNQTFNEEISNIATSLKIESGKCIDRKKLLKEIIIQFEALYNQFLLNENLEFIVDEYNKYCVNIGKELRVIYKNSEINGTGVGLMPNGSLCIKLKDGKNLEIQSGEVSVRGIYGYI